MHSRGNLIESSFLLGGSPLDWLLNSLIWLVLLRFIVWPFIVVPLLDLLDFRRQQATDTVVFELVPYHMSSVSTEAMVELFKVLHAQCESRELRDRLLRRKQRISFGLVSSRVGLRYIVRVPSPIVESFKRAITALQHEIEFRPVQHDPVPVHETYSVLETFRQSRPFTFPLRSHPTLEVHDPVTYLSSMLSNPRAGELFALQFVMSPYGATQRITQARKRILKHETSTLRDARVTKLKEPLFYVDIRAYVSSDEQIEGSKRMADITSALVGFDEPGRQMLTAASVLSQHPFVKKIVRLFIPTTARAWLRRCKLRSFKDGLPSVLTINSNILSTSEVAGLYHFPYEQAVTTEGMSRSMSRMLPVPNDLKRNADEQAFDLVLGENDYHGHTTQIGLTEAERQRHVYIIGGTGNGKTAMLEYGMVQDMRSSKGVALIDPHGDSARKLLRYVPTERIKDVIYFNPRDYEYAIGFNPLELKEGLRGSALAHEKDMTTEAIVSVLGKVFDAENAGAYRIERILRNAIQTAFTIESATLFTVLKLLAEATYRKQIVSTLTDERLRRFWLEEFGKAGDMQRIKLALGPITRLERFEASESVRRVLGQPRSTINFDDILNNGKILVCNFSKGSLGEDTSTLFGAIVLAELQLAAWRREKLPQEDRRPFHVYVDEFQNFASESFVGFFSEARKYALFVTMAQQSVSQLKDQSMVNTILDNAGTVVAFRSKSAATEQLLLHQFSPYIRQGDILNLPSYAFYAKIAATTPMEPLSGRTIVLPKHEASEDTARKVVETSRERYAT
jgi:hypothetical protein